LDIVTEKEVGFVKISACMRQPSTVRNWGRESMSFPTSVHGYLRLPQSFLIIGETEGLKQAL